MLPFKWFKMIPFKIVEYSYTLFNDCLFTCPHARNSYKIEICISFSSVCYIWVFAVTNGPFECHDIFYNALQIDYTSSKFKHNQSLDFYD